MNFQNISFITSAVDIKGYPDCDLPEIMIWGKSNVGKSSFINSLTGVNGISKVSSKPGKTKTINFFNVDNKLMLVDVPGYGYASVSKKMQLKFLDFILEYVSKRKNLKLVLFLLDSRHKPTDQDKKWLNSLLKFDLDVAIIATKVDKLNQSYKVKLRKNFKEALNLEEGDYIVASSTKNINFNIVRDMLEDY